MLSAESRTSPSPSPQHSALSTQHWGLAGHGEAVAQLRRALAEGRLAHAYLFEGPAGIGKTALARALARAVNCRAPEPPCDACSICRRIEAMTFSDVELISPVSSCDVSEHDHGAETGRDIRICQVRRAERVLGLAAYEGGRRVLIVEPAEAMNQQAADAFLKTLEEPPQGAMIILVARNAGALIETVRSRCRSVPLRPAPVDEAARVLQERFEATPAQAARLIARFGGRIGAAVAALRDPAHEERHQSLAESAAQLAGADLPTRFKAAESLAGAYAKRERPKAAEDDAKRPPATMGADGKARGRDDVFITLDAWLDWWRDLLLSVAGAPPAHLSAADTASPAIWSDRFDLSAAKVGVDAIRQGRQDLEQNVNPRLALEAMMLRLPRPVRPGGDARTGKEAE